MTAAAESVFDPPEDMCAEVWFDSGDAIDAQCGERNTFYGYVCQRASGHDGSHVEFRDNSTVAWGKP